MENVDKQELCPCQKRDKYARIHKALEKCASVDEDYANYLLFIKDGGVGYGGDNLSCTCNDVEDDPQYMNFLANTKPHGTSYVSKFVDQNGFPVFIKYEEDGELEIHGVEKSQDDVRGKYKMGESSKGLKDNARENRELEIHGGEKGQDSVKEKYKRDKHARIHEALEKCASVDGDYAKYLLFIKDGGVGYGGDNPNCTCNDVEYDPQYMNFLANTKPDGTSYVSKFVDQNGLPVFIKYEEDGELEIHGVEKGQDDIREKHKMGECLKGLKANARENRSVSIVEKQKTKDVILSKKQGNEDRELEFHGVENGQDNVHANYKLGRNSKALKINARKNRMEDGISSKKQGNEDRMEDGIQNPNCICDDVEDDPQYMNFLANTKPDGTSYVSKFVDQNGLPVFVKYEEDGELKIHGVEKGQDDVRENHKMGQSLKGLKANARENRSVSIVEKQKMKDVILSKKQGNAYWGLEFHGVENGQDNVQANFKLGRNSKALKINAKKNRMEDGISSKKRGNEDRMEDGIQNPNCTCNDVEDDPQYMNFLANTKPDGTSYVSKFVDQNGLLVDQNGLPVFVKYEENGELKIHGVEKGQDDIREKHKMGESLKGLKANARENRSVSIVEKQKMKDVILSKKQGNEDRELEFHGVENGQDNVQANYKLGRNSKALKINARKNRMEDGISSKKRGNEDRDIDDRKRRIDVKIVPGKEQKMKDRILSKNRENEDRDLDSRIQRIDVKIVPGKKQKTQNGSKFMDAGVNVEPKEDYDSLEESVGSSCTLFVPSVESEGSSCTLFVPSVEHRQNLDATIIDFAYRKELLNLLMRPYNDEEYKKLWKDIKMQLPSSSTNGRGKSLLSRHKDVNRAIKRTNHNKDKKLNIMRGFFFWLEHLTRQDAFQPWEDEECLRTMPGSS